GSREQGAGPPTRTAPRSPLPAPCSVLPNRRFDAIRPHHRIPRLTPERVREFFEVRQRTHHSPPRRRVWVHGHLIAQVLVGGLGAPDLGPGEEEPLFGAEAVDVGWPLPASARTWSTASPASGSTSGA